MGQRDSCPKGPLFISACCSSHVGPLGELITLLVLSDQSNFFIVLRIVRGSSPFLCVHTFKDCSSQKALLRDFFSSYFGVGSLSAQEVTMSNISEQ